MTDVFQATHDLLARTVDSPASFAFQLLPSSDCIDFRYDKRGDDQQVCFCAG
jgi:hypothetical protein